MHGSTMWVAAEAGWAARQAEAIYSDRDGQIVTMEHTVQHQIALSQEVKRWLYLASHIRHGRMGVGGLVVQLIEQPILIGDVAVELGIQSDFIGPVVQLDRTQVS
jgi:hypothetical protein